MREKFIYYDSDMELLIAFFTSTTYCCVGRKQRMAGATVRNARAKHVFLIPSSSSPPHPQMLLPLGLFPHNGASFHRPFSWPDQPPIWWDVQNAPLFGPVAHQYLLFQVPFLRTQKSEAKSSIYNAICSWLVAGGTRKMEYHYKKVIHQKNKRNDTVHIRVPTTAIS